MGLVDGGANGGILNGKDMHLIYFHPDNCCVNISAVENHKITVVDWLPSVLLLRLVLESFLAFSIIMLSLLNR